MYSLFILDGIIKIFLASEMLFIILTEKWLESNWKYVCFNENRVFLI